MWCCLEKVNKTKSPNLHCLEHGNKNNHSGASLKDSKLFIVKNMASHLHKTLLSLFFFGLTRTYFLYWLTLSLSPCDWFSVNQSIISMHPFTKNCRILWTHYKNVIALCQTGLVPTNKLRKYWSGVCCGCCCSWTTRRSATCWGRCTRCIRAAAPCFQTRRRRRSRSRTRRGRVRTTTTMSGTASRCRSRTSDALERRRSLLQRTWLKVFITHWTQCPVTAGGERGGLGWAGGDSCTEKHGAAAAGEVFLYVCARYLVVFAFRESFGILSFERDAACWSQALDGWPAKWTDNRTHASGRSSRNFTELDRPMCALF